MSKSRSELRRAWGKSTEIYNSLVDSILALGGDDTDVARLQDYAKEIAKFTVAGKLAFPAIRRRGPEFDYDMRLHGWLLDSDVESDRGVSYISRNDYTGINMELVEFVKLEPNCEFVTTSFGCIYMQMEYALFRARELEAAMSQRVAEDIMRMCPYENADKLFYVPAEWRPYKLLFAGTVWTDPAGYKRVAVDSWNEKKKRWEISFPRDHSFTDDYRLLRQRYK